MPFSNWICYLRQLTSGNLHIILRGWQPKPKQATVIYTRHQPQEVVATWALFDSLNGSMYTCRWLEYLGFAISLFLFTVLFSYTICTITAMRLLKTTYHGVFTFLCKFQIVIVFSFKWLPGNCIYLQLLMMGDVLHL